MSARLPTCEVSSRGSRCRQAWLTSFAGFFSPSLFLPRELGRCSWAGNKHHGVYYEVCPTVCLPLAARPSGPCPRWARCGGQSLGTAGQGSRVLPGLRGAGVGPGNRGALGAWKKDDSISAPCVEGVFCVELESATPLYMLYLIWSSLQWGEQLDDPLYG